MNEPTSNQTLDIQGTINTYTRVGGKVCGAIALVGFGILSWSEMEAPWSANGQNNVGLAFVAIILFIIAAVLPYNEHTYLHFANRHIGLASKKRREK